MKSINLQKQKGFTLLEIVIGVVIFIFVLNLINLLSTNYYHQFRIAQNASTIAQVPQAVQRRNLHDSYLFEFWDTNGGLAATNDDLAFTQIEFDTFLTNYLVGHENPQCGNNIEGWDPQDRGVDPTTMERAALVGCNTLRGLKPFRVELSAVLTFDSATGVVSRFIMYIDTSNIDFGIKNNTNNNIVNYTQFQQALLSELNADQYGSGDVYFGRRGNLDDADDDIKYTTTQCSDELINENTCDIIVEIDYAGATLGFYKRTDNQDFFVDDVTFGPSIAAGRQTCAYWVETAPGTWEREIVDCAIKGGVGDNSVQLVADASTLDKLTITGRGLDEANGDVFVAEANALCETFIEDPLTQQLIIPADVDDETRSPCGFVTGNDRNGAAIIQLLTQDAHVRGTAFIEDIKVSTIYGGIIDVYTNNAGTIILQAWDESHNESVFQVNNNGTTETVDLIVRNNAEVRGDLLVENNAAFTMSNGSIVDFANGGLTLINNPNARFEIQTNTDILAIETDNDQGLSIIDNGGNSEIRLNALDGVISDNGTTFHSSFSSMRGQNFDDVNGINSNALKNLSQLVTSDMAQMLHDTSSPIQVVGVERVEGEFTVLTKPDCLAFMDNANFSSADANPYANILGSVGNGEDYARLVLIPMYFKTFNSAFGDNQIFAQHAAHSSATTWDVFLYLSGEGAFGTGAREDGAGGSLALMLCDYSSINFSNLTF
jgi:type II secretory pathway pseudopilin PulG